MSSFNTMSRRGSGLSVKQYRGLGSLISDGWKRCIAFQGGCIRAHERIIFDSQD